VVASGTPCAGFFPLARVAVDGQILGALQLRGPKVGIYTVWGSISRGRHKVSVAFINDDSIPGKEDRNLLVEKVLVARDQSPGVVALTNPAATVAVRLGKGMIVVDRVRWDSDPVNAGKAARYACSLIGELGGDLACRTGVTLRCENMTPQPGMPFFQKQGGLASLACNGYIAGPLQVATSGRYTMEIFAGGSPAQGEFPIIEVLLDGRKVTSVQTTAFDCRPYPVSVDLTQGKHELRLAFVNDLNVGGEDRNLFLEKVVFSRE
jgi:hypothetical protein